MGQNDNLIEDYRNLVTNILLENPTIVEVLSDGKFSLEEADKLMWTHIFPNQYIPDTITKTGSFILYDLSDSVISRVNKTYIEVTLYFWVLTHWDMPKYNHSLRNDILARELRKDFGEKDCFGIAKSHYVSNQIYNSGTNKYTARLLTFRITDWSDKIRYKSL